MHESQIGVNALTAVVLWGTATLAVLAGTIALAVEHLHLALAFYAHAMLLIGIAATATLKFYIHQNRQLLTDAVAYVSREAGRSGDGTPVRRLGD